MLSKIVDLDFEKKCLERYQEIVESILETAEDRGTTLEQDLQILERHNNGESKISEKSYFAVIYRSELKKTLRAQLEMAKFLQTLLKESYEIRSIIISGAP